MAYDYNLEDIKSSLTIEQIHTLVAELGGNPRPIQGDFFVAQTICHNPPGHGSYKLYYYSNTGLLHCFSECAESFDIFELVRKVKAQGNKEYSLPQAVSYVANYFGFSKEVLTEEEESSLQEYFSAMEKYDRVENINPITQLIDLKEYDGSFLKNLPHPIIESWYRQGISLEVMNQFEIAYEPRRQVIVIPHRDIKGHLIGIRQRTLIKEDEIYGKYLPLKIGKELYAHPLGFNIFGIYQNKENISRMRKAIVAEGEKSVLLMGSLLGQENNICVASCGSALTNYQVTLLLSLGVNEIIICPDREGEKDDKNKYVKKFYQMHNRYGNLCKISFMWDKYGEYLDYKENVFDKNDKELFLKMLKERINLY